MPTTDENNEWEAMLTQALLDSALPARATVVHVMDSGRVYWYLRETGGETENF